MTLVLLALDESEESIGAARQARRLFGADATYLAVYVSETPPGWTAIPTAWGSVYPYPYAAPYPLVEEELAGAESDRPVREDARDTAEQLAGEAGVSAAAAVGEVGDPAEAILSAADRHHADVIVVGATHKNWWRRLLEGSVSQDLVRRSHRPVLVAGQDAADDA
jgi:nucleotide-binding universal stress UspA family protein